MTKNKLNLEVNSKDNKGDTEKIVELLLDFNRNHIGPQMDQPENPYNLILKTDEGEVAGGALCYHKYNRLYLDVLVIDENYKGQGYGSKLMKEVEIIADKLKCTHICLETFAFQAPEFYEKLGYKRTLELKDHKYPDFPIYYYKKELNGGV